MITDGPQGKAVKAVFLFPAQFSAIPGSGIRRASYAPQRAFPRVKVLPLGPPPLPRGQPGPHGLLRCRRVLEGP